MSLKRVFSKRRRLIRRLAVVSVAIIAIGSLASWIVAGRLIAARPCQVGAAPPDLPANSISLQSESGATIAGWEIPADDSRGVVVLIHGIRGSRLTMLDRARMLFHSGYSIVMIDLQAHGESSGNRTTIGYLEKHDVRAAVAFAKRSHPGEPIAVVGVSLGGASAVLASPLGIDALVLESVFPDIDSAVHNRVAATLGPLSTIPAELLLVQLNPRLGISRSDLRPIDYVSKVGCPLLIIAGSDDRYTTAAETRRMYAAACEPKNLWFFKGVCHEDLCRASATEYERHVLGFLKRNMRKRKAVAMNQ